MTAADDATRHSAGEPARGLAGLRERVADRSAAVVEAGPVDDGGFRLHVSVPIA